jgi:hypothetical protein
MIGAAVIDENHLVCLANSAQRSRQPFSQFFQRRRLVKDGDDNREIELCRAPLPYSPRFV